MFSLLITHLFIREVSGTVYVGFFPYHRRYMAHPQHAQKRWSYLPTLLREGVAVTAVICNLENMAVAEWALGGPGA